MHYSHAISTAALLAASLPSVLAQTYTDCNPLQKTCPSDPGMAATFNTDFSTGHAGWTSVNSGVTYGSSAAFTITGDGQAPTIQSDNYLFFGRVDVTMESAPGVGIVSSIVLQSDDLDEIDWEFLGGDATHVQSNFFGKGDTSTYDRVTYIAIANSQASYHTYSIDWTADRIQWLVDGAVVRTLAYADALAQGGARFPQTPCRVKIGNWVAGGANNAAGTIQWAGGKTDFSQAPFVMNVKSISITNYNPGSSYTYSDMTGSYKSITVAGGSGAVVGGSSAAVSSVVPTTTSTTSVVQPTTSSTTSSSALLTSIVTVPQKVTTSTSTTSSSTDQASTTSIVVASLASATMATSTTSQATVASSTAKATYTGAASSLQIGTAGSLAVAAAAMLLL